MIVLSPRTLDAALDALRTADERTRVLAGGTDLMVEMESGRTRPARIVDVWRVDALRGIHVGAEGLVMGALTTCADLVRDERVRLAADVLGEAARWVGAAQIRERATLGGNLGTASPAADLTPVLLALDARVRLVSTRGTRELAVAEFLTGYRATARAHDELIAAIVVPPRPRDERRGFQKVGTRKAQSISKLVVCVALEARAGVVTRASAAAGSVADRTVRLASVSELAGIDVRRDPSACLRVARAAAERDVTPRDDVRSTAAYRREVLARVLGRLLHDLASAP